VLGGCTARPLPPGPTDADVARYYDAIADSHWDALGFGPSVERPATPATQFSTPETWAASVARCMNDAGFDEYSAQGGSLTITEPDPNPSTEQKLASYICELSYQPAAVTGQILSAAQLDYVYDYYLRFLIPCLELQGETLDDVPSREAFVAQSALGPWSPYWGIVTRDTERFERLRTECPPMPPGLSDPLA
jgi:hypothetical protein